MVAVVGRPAQHQLGKVTGAHHDAVLLVSDVHQDLGALSCLGIFIGHIGHAFIMADITKMLPYRRRDGDGAQRNAQPFA